MLSDLKLAAEAAVASYVLVSGAGLDAFAELVEATCSRAALHLSPEVLTSMMSSAAAQQLARQITVEAARLANGGGNGSMNN